MMQHCSPVKSGVVVVAGLQDKGAASKPQDPLPKAAMCKSKKEKVRVNPSSVISCCLL